MAQLGRGHKLRTISHSQMFFTLLTPGAMLDGLANKPCYFREKPTSA